MSRLLKIHNAILKLSIRWKIFFAMMIVAIGITAGVTQFALWQQEEIITTNVVITGHFIAASLADHIAGLLAQSQYFEVREILKSIQQKADRILLIAVNDMTTPRKEIVAAIGDDQWIQSTQTIFSDRVHVLNGMDQYIFFEPVHIRGVEKLLGTVRVGLSLKFMHERLVQTRDTMLAIMAASIGFALLLAFVISDTVLKPLQNLTSGILKIAGGQFSHRVKVESRDETGVMANTFNRMTENLTILQEVSTILNEQAGPQEVLTAVLARLARNISGKTGAVVFHGVDAEEMVAGEAEETSLSYLRKLRADTRSETTEHPKPLVEPSRLCFPFFSENEITGGIWMVRPTTSAIDEIDERLLNGVSDQLESTLSKLEFQYRAVTDAMTGLFNHRYFQQEINRQLERAQRLGTAFTLVMADLDYFKKINDTYGHQQGDIVLRGVAGAIRKSVRGKIDVACRYGGEEFAIILPETSLEGAKIFSERFRHAVEELDSDFKGKSVKITVSIGLATYPEAAKEKRQLIECADRALYLAKESGRNNVKTYKDIKG